MRNVFTSTIFSVSLLTAIVSCGDNNATANTTFCDTACNTDTLRFEGGGKMQPYVSISQKNCIADTLTWTHEGLPSKRQMQMPTLLDNTVRVNKAAATCYIKDTSYAYLSFNDCISGRGYLLKLPFNKRKTSPKFPAL